MNCIHCQGSLEIRKMVLEESRVRDRWVEIPVCPDGHGGWVNRRSLDAIVAEAEAVCERGFRNLIVGVVFGALVASPMWIIVWAKLAQAGW